METEVVGFWDIDAAIKLEEILFVKRPGGVFDRHRLEIRDVGKSYGVIGECCAYILMEAFHIEDFSCAENWSS